MYMEKRYSKNLNNKGFSLIELLVVIVIVAVITGMTTITLVVVDNANVSKAANTFNTAINTARVQSMSRGPEAGGLHITRENGILYYQIGPGDAKHEICSPAIDVQMVVGNYTATAGVPITTDGDIASISFNSAGMVIGASSSSLTKLIFIRGNRRVETVLYNETGKHEVNLL